MKSSIKSIILLGLSVLLASCNAGDSSASSTSLATSSEATSSVEESSIVTSEATSEIIESSVSSAIESSSKEKVYPEEVYSSLYGEDAAKTMVDTLGAVVPYFGSDYFDYEVTVDDFGDPAMWLYLYYEVEDDAYSGLEPLAWTLYEDGGYACTISQARFVDYETYSYFYVDVLYADKVLTRRRAIEIQAVASNKSYEGKMYGCIGMYCFNYLPNVTPKEFPTLAIESLVGKNDIPVIDNSEGLYTFDFTFYLLEDGSKALLISVDSEDGVFDLEELYFNLLIEQGYLISRFDDLNEEYLDEPIFNKNNAEYPGYEDSYTFIATKLSGKYMITFEADISYQGFYINILKLK